MSSKLATWIKSKLDAIEDVPRPSDWEAMEQLINAQPTLIKLPWYKSLGGISAMVGVMTIVIGSTFYFTSNEENEVLPESIIEQNISNDLSGSSVSDEMNLPLERGTSGSESSENEEISQEISGQEASSLEIRESSLIPNEVAASGSVDDEFQEPQLETSSTLEDISSIEQPQEEEIAHSSTLTSISEDVSTMVEQDANPVVLAESVTNSDPVMSSQRPSDPSAGNTAQTRSGGEGSSSLTQSLGGNGSDGNSSDLASNSGGTSDSGSASSTDQDQNSESSSESSESNEIAADSEPDEIESFASKESEDASEEMPEEVAEEIANEATDEAAEKVAGEIAEELPSPIISRPESQKGVQWSMNAYADFSSTSTVLSNSEINPGAGLNQTSSPFGFGLEATASYNSWILSSGLMIHKESFDFSRESSTSTYTYNYTTWYEVDTLTETTYDSTWVIIGINQGEWRTDTIVTTSYYETVFERFDSTRRTTVSSERRRVQGYRVSVPFLVGKEWDFGKWRTAVQAGPIITLASASWYEDDRFLGTREQWGTDIMLRAELGYEFVDRFEVFGRVGFRVNATDYQNLRRAAWSSRSVPVALGLRYQF